MILCGRTITPTTPIFAVAGPCVIESEALTMAVAQALAQIADRLHLFLIFKSSFDKANRSSDKSFRGLGMDEGLRILEKVRSETGLPVITDVHEAAQVPAVAQVVDVLQTPAFLARQTDFIAAVAQIGNLRPPSPPAAHPVGGGGDGLVHAPGIVHIGARQGVVRHYSQADFVGHQNHRPGERCQGLHQRPGFRLRVPARGHDVGEP